MTNGDTVNLGIADSDVVDIEIVGHIISRGHKPFNACSWALDEYSRASLRRNLLNALREEGCDHCMRMNEPITQGKYNNPHSQALWNS